MENSKIDYDILVMLMDIHDTEIITPYKLDKISEKYNKISRQFCDELRRI